jgi:hypothetical protein
MWSRELVEKQLTEKSLDGFCWGRTGEAAVEELERRLGLRLPDELREFAASVGNLTVFPFEIIVTGDSKDGGEMSCVTETEAMRNFRDDTPEQLICILESAGVVYCAAAGQDRILSFDTEYVMWDEVLQEWNSFPDLLSWVMSEAGSLQ